eukprot:g10390.t1 g10390   contig4:1783319-1784817(-)
MSQQPNEADDNSAAAPSIGEKVKQQQDSAVIDYRATAEERFLSKVDGCLPQQFCFANDSFITTVPSDENSVVIDENSSSDSASSPVASTNLNLGVDVRSRTHYDPMNIDMVVLTPVNMSNANESGFSFDKVASMIPDCHQWFGIYDLEKQLLQEEDEIEPSESKVSSLDEDESCNETSTYEGSEAVDDDSFTNRSGTDNESYTDGTFDVETDEDTDEEPQCQASFLTRFINPSYEEAANNRDFLDAFDSTESDTSISKDSKVSAISKSSHMLSVAELSDRSKTLSVEVVETSEHHVEESESIEITEAEAASIVVEPVAVPSPSLRSNGCSIKSFLKTRRTPEKSKACDTSVVPSPAHPVAATPTSKSGQGVVLAEEDRKNVLECIEGISAEEVIPPYAIKKLETPDTSSSSMLKSNRDGSSPKASPVQRGVTVRGSPNTILTESYSQSDAGSIKASVSAEGDTNSVWRRVLL